tara:strand:+ start:107 stop:3193 length:3087 start_codon:yes stop_codon:yes gene_type:complete
MKIKNLIIVMLLFICNNIIAQNISGIVSSDDGTPLPGATIVNIETNQGTSSDFDGNYTISAEEGQTLEFSFLGYDSVQIKITSTDKIDVVLQISSLDEVVVSAFGFEKDIKSIGYSVSQVEGDELSRVKSTNPLQALRGKIAGVSINSNASGVKNSTRVVIRGNSSFGGNNQPLYIVDGISIQNEQLGAAGEWGGVDNGDGLSAINPDDIKNVSVLKGGAAAALYGSRASNGVILITTKNGSGEKQGIGIELSNQTQFTSINGLHSPQTQYGNGTFGNAPVGDSDPFNSWGPRITGGMIYDNLSALYDNAISLTNSAAFTSNTEKGSTRISFTKLDSEDVINTSKLNRNSVNFSSSQKLSDKVTVNASIKYSETEENGNVVMATAPMSPNGAVRDFAPNVDINNFIGPEGNGTSDGENEYKPYVGLFTTNPWFAKFNNITSSFKDRLLGNVNIKYDVTDFLYIRGQAGMDRGTNHLNNNIINGAPLFQPGVAYNPGGQLWEQTQTIKQHDADFFIGTDNVDFNNDFSFNGFVGVGTFEFQSEALAVLGDQTVIPQLYTLLNTSSQSAFYNYNEKKINSVYGSTEFSFQDKIYLSVTARNDWFSTLSAPGKTTPNNDLYGSASLSVILSDLIALPSFFSFAKLRGGVSQVAGGADNPYALSLTYGLTGSGHLGSPLGIINGSAIPNQSLNPFQKDEVEIGLDLRMLDNRISLDLAYYQNTTTGDIVNASASSASGFGSTLINLGEMSNEGIELLLRANVIDKSDFGLDFSFNFTNNTNIVNKTDEAGNNILLATGQLFQTNIGIQEGQPYGVIYGNKYVRDSAGNIVHTIVNGIPIPKSENNNEVIGLGVAPTTVGFGTNLSYKDFDLNIFLEGKYGGSIISNTNSRMKSLGLHQDTAPNGTRNGFIPNGIMEDGSAMPQVPEADLQLYWNTGNANGTTAAALGEGNVYENDFLRISQVSLSYNFPQSLLQNTFIRRAAVGLVGNNLGFIFKDVPNIDPEAYYQSRALGVEGIAMPIGESIGFSVNLKL